MTSVVSHGHSPSANVTRPRNEGSEHSQLRVQGIIPWPPEAGLLCFFIPLAIFNDEGEVIQGVEVLQGVVDHGDEVGAFAFI
ncbi:hypothetical protein DSLASN_31180 [Desulfoluna limicola]|uniref:Uncharacterized protein n=1 Tax=Desulfoluna limicola TaxID=2810562 RepID=A0ABM7PJK4_9BACT|nr:hypothetical protein DSLASN_31180 [Desulfoluna limicola]